MDKMEKATEKKKGFVKEFVDFLQTFGVIGLAIGFVIDRGVGWLERRLDARWGLSPEDHP